MGGLAPLSLAGPVNEPLEKRAPANESLHSGFQGKSFRTAKTGVQNRASAVRRSMVGQLTRGKQKVVTEKQMEDGVEEKSRSS